MQEKTKRKRLLLLILALVLLVLGILIALVSYLINTGILFPSRNFGVISQSNLVEVPYNSVTQDTLYITHDRKAYEGETMRLLIPSLGLDTPIGADTRPRGLEKMPGLYEFSQMPSHQDVNVSIAGHRDIGNKEFYDLDKVIFGDYFYLIYENTVYQYEFYESMVVKADDWSVINRRGFSALTLTTCDPIGTRLNRLIAVGNLVDSYPFVDGMELPAN